MIRIETEKDPEVLRQMALLLERENRRLFERITHLTEEIAKLRGSDNQQLQLELDALKELLASRERALFGDSSERRHRHDDKTDSTPRRPRKGHGPRPQPQLPLIEKIHELAEDKRDCSFCGGQLTEWANQFEESEEITVVKRHFTLVKHKRRKYRCACNAKVETAPGPPKLQNGARYSVDFAVEVAVAKYMDHMPLNRQCRQMDREGLIVDTQTLFDQLAVLAVHLRPSYEALKGRVLGDDLVFADETPWRYLGRASTKRWWAWSVSGPDAVYHLIAESRSHDVAGQLLDGYRGNVMADGYAAYTALQRERARDGPTFRLLHCWAHVRRKFVEIEQIYPQACLEVLELIGQLYAVERSVPVSAADAPDAQKAEALALRGRMRQEWSRPLVKAIYDWALAQRPLPQSGLGKAIAYMTGMWTGLTGFLEDPRVPLDNNAAERSLRGVVLGRKNHYGSHSRRGTEVAALFYSLIESALMAGAEPGAYLLHAAHAAIEKPGIITLPHDCLS